MPAMFTTQVPTGKRACRSVVRQVAPVKSSKGIAPIGIVRVESVRLESDGP
jgi:hypothetical protein